MANRKSDEKTPSAAQALVQLAAYRIDLSPRHLEVVVDRLDEEFITELWQLSFLDSVNWKELGAPIGLVAAIRACLQEKEESNEIIDTLHSSSTTSLQLHTQSSTDPRYSEITTTDFDVSARHSTISSSIDNNSGSSNIKKRIVRTRSSECPKVSPAMGDLPPQSAHRRLSDRTETSFSTSGVSTLPSPMPPVKERVTTAATAAASDGDFDGKRRGSNDGKPAQPIRRETKIMDEAYLRSLDLSEGSAAAAEETPPPVTDLHPDKPKRRSTAIREEDEDSDVEVAEEEEGEEALKN